MNEDLIPTKITELEKEIKECNKNVGAILGLLKGNELDNEGGLIHRIKEMEKCIEKLEQRCEKLEKWKDRIFWIAVGVSTASGFGISQFLK